MCPVRSVTYLSGRSQSREQRFPPISSFCSHKRLQLGAFAPFDVDRVIGDFDVPGYVTCLRLLDAKTDGADWEEVARIVLHRDPAGDEARREGHLRAPNGFRLGDTGAS